MVPEHVLTHFAKLLTLSMPITAPVSAMARKGYFNVTCHELCLVIPLTGSLCGFGFQELCSNIYRGCKHMYMHVSSVRGSCGLKKQGLPSMEVACHSNEVIQERFSNRLSEH